MFKQKVLMGVRMVVLKKRQTVTHVRKDVEERELLYIADGIIKWSNYFGKECGSFLKILI